jgi:hypothetical protein
MLAETARLGLMDYFLTTVKSRVLAEDWCYPTACSVLKALATPKAVALLLNEPFLDFCRDLMHTEGPNTAEALSAGLALICQLMHTKVGPCSCCFFPVHHILRCTLLLRC